MRPTVPRRRPSGAHPERAAPALDQAMTERQLCEAVIEAAQTGGWLAQWHPDSRRMVGTPGWPDIVLVRPPEILAIECKSARGRVTVEQRAWLDALDAVPCVEALVIRPDDLPRLVKRLTRRPAGMGMPRPVPDAQGGGR